MDSTVWAQAHGPGSVHRLAEPLTSLIGREEERAELAGMLLRDSVRLLTLTGPGGVGKTRLGLRLAAECGAAFSDGVRAVGLAAIRDPALVPAVIADAVNIPKEGELPLPARLADALQSKRMLLMLDNFEHVVAAAPLVVDLLAACPGLKMVVTSRAALRVTGEQQFVVSPLRLPPTDLFSDLETLEQVSAVALFVTRAQAVRPGFMLTLENAQAVAAICRRLDGLPLAIELAATRIKLLPPNALIARLERRLPLLTGGGSDVPVRMRAMRDAIAWSYDLLDDHEKRHFRRLTIFVGGCTLEAAESICQRTFGHEAQVPNESANHSPLTAFPTPLDLIASLIDKSLLLQEEQDDGEPRLRMHETVREFGFEMLERRGETEAVRRWHAEYFLALACSAEGELRGPGQADWLRRLEREHDNLRAALTWSLTDDPAGNSSEGSGLLRVDLGLRLARALHWFWYIRCHLTEGRQWLEPLLAKSDGVPDHVRAGGLVTLGRMVQAQGDFARSVEHFEEGARLYQQAGEQWWAAFSIGVWGQSAMYTDGYDAADVLLQESLALFRVLGDQWGTGWSLGNLGRLAQMRGEQERSLALLDESLRCKRQVGDPFALALSLLFRGRTAFSQGDYVDAIAPIEESLRLFRRIGYVRGIGGALTALGRVARGEGRLERAITYLAESIQVHREEAFKAGVVECLHALAGTVMQRASASIAAPGARRKQMLVAARLFGAAEALREAIGTLVSPADRPGYERDQIALRAALDPSALAEAWAEGRDTDWREAVERALVPAPDGGAPLARPWGITTFDESTDTGARARLSRRQVEVAALVARGRTNREIAADLVVSPRTVESHITNILSKLGLTSRSQLVAWVLGNGLLPDSLSGGPVPLRVVDRRRRPG